MIKLYAPVLLDSTESRQSPVESWTYTIADWPAQVLALITLPLSVAAMPAPASEQRRMENRSRFFMNVCFGLKKVFKGLVLFPEKMRGHR
jgi:hypothetical protein